ncbi:MAG: alpha-mannosidase, partial [Halanaerobiaceae bacterium]
WEIVGGWWVEPDCNIPGGESYVRHALYSQRYFKDKFGKKAVVGFNADSFGHNGMLPQILKKSGLDYYIFMRPMPGEKGLPGRLFQWEADDGSQVLAFRIPYEYNTWGQDVENYVRRCSKELKEPYTELMFFYGVGNHGGGPTRENIKSIKKLNEEKNDLPDLKFNTPEKFFEKIEKEELPLPVVHDDLQHHSSGCYSAHSGIKKWNREAENRLIKSEKFSVLADKITGQTYAEDFTRAWKNVLFNQFHDIMAGTSLKSAYEDARNMHGEAMSIADRNMNYALQSISWNIDIEERKGMKPIVVFNPHSWNSKVNLEIEAGKIDEDSRLIDEKGREIPLQLVQSEATAWGRKRITFTADLPPLGYKVYKLLPEVASQEYREVKATDYYMENQKYRLEFNPDNGFIKSLYDKEKDFEVFAGEAAIPVVINDESDTWSHDVFKFDDEIDQFQVVGVKLVEKGPVKSVIRIISQYNNSQLIQDFTMYSELDKIDVSVKVNWQEQLKMLKLRFPVNLYSGKTTYEIPYGYKEREANGEEEPGQSWLDISGIRRDENEVYGLSLLNDAKYSYDVLNNTMSLTLLRSPAYAHHNPAELETDKNYSYIDQGIQEFNYTLLPHEGSREDSDTVQKALELNQKPVVIKETFHEGELPQSNSYINVNRDNIIITSLKKAEDGGGIIVRCLETDKEKTQVKIEFPEWDKIIETEFDPCEIKTFYIADNSGKIIETNLIEEKTDQN